MKIYLLNECYFLAKKPPFCYTKRMENCSFSPEFNAPQDHPFLMEGALPCDPENLEKYAWHLHARENQKIPAGDWRIWLILAGRGFGKTRTGAETIRLWIETKQARRIALIGDTQEDVRDIMIEGESGLLAIYPPDDQPLYEPSKRRLTWKNGTIATAYSAENYEQLRGPQFDHAWIDEFAKFREIEKVWQQIHFSLRLGPNPRMVITTTPRPLPLLQHLVAQEGQEIVITRGTTFENQANLSPLFMSTMQKSFAGTRLGAQELLGEIIDTHEGALWAPAVLDQYRVSEVPELKRIVIGIDPAVTHHSESDETGIIVVGLGGNQHAYVLEDLSGRYAATTWGRIACEAYQRWKADRIVAEVNKGGDLVESLLRSIDPQISYQGVHASRGKYTRAEPIAAFYEQGKIHHARQGLKQLEDQMCKFLPGMTSSPDRVDALVWALTALLLNSVNTYPYKTWTF
jgi:phage terminase large subunit-like protein